MNQLAKAAEPSMEEILASIRRIIADDDAGKGAPASEAPTAGAQHEIETILNDEAESGEESIALTPVADVLELTESMQVHTPFEAVEGPADVTFSDDAGASPEPERPQPPDPAPRVETPQDRPLLSPRAASAVDMAFNSLAHTVLVQNARTLEDLVREMLKPMLKSWLDDNLPNMVERLVRAEIERVSRGRG